MQPAQPEFAAVTAAHRDLTGRDESGDSDRRAVLAVPALRGLARGRTGALRRSAAATVRRALAPQDVAAITQRATQLGQRVDAALQRVPASFSQNWGAAEHPAVDRIRNARAAAASPAANDLDPVMRDLDTATDEIAAFESFLDANGELLDEVDELYTAYERPAPAGPAAANGAPAAPHPLAAVQTDVVALKPTLQELARDLLLGQGNRKAIEAFRREVERVVMPDNKSMQGLRQSNATQAAEVISRMIDGGLVRPQTMMTPWKAAPYDTGPDNFGLGWTLTMSGNASGAGQWLREWEYHIHGRAVRAPGPVPGPGELMPVTGFDVKKGHIKPSKNPRALGVSINITNQKFLDEIKGYEDQFARWANGRGKQLLLSK
jgi:phage terminase Nu1 subunit (DNA packaging protein)